MAYVPSALRGRVVERAQHRCEYCQSPEAITGGPFHVEHIFPEALGGLAIPDNLALSCARCNSRKAYGRAIETRSVGAWSPSSILVLKSGRVTSLGEVMEHTSEAEPGRGGPQSMLSI